MEVDILLNAQINKEKNEIWELTDVKGKVKTGLQNDQKANQDTTDEKEWRNLSF